MALYFITTNQGKYDEMREILAPLTLIRVNTRYPELQADSLEEVVQFGMAHLPGDITGSVIIEDSGLFISALQGLPGVYSAPVFRTIGIRGILKLLEGVALRDAEFQSVIGYRGPDGRCDVFKGICTGCISEEPRGAGGFGYDPIFIPQGCSQTFAEMTSGEKNRLSHRGRAAKHLKDFLVSR